MSNALPTLLAPPPLLSQEVQTEEFLPEESLSRWPKDILEAYARERGPYTVENAETILEEEPVELFNGWLVWQEMTDLFERRTVATIQAMLDLSARNLGFGQAIPDQAECLLSNGDVVKPDASLVSWERLRYDVYLRGKRQSALLDGGPELVVEVRSPSNRRGQEKAKRTLYFQNKVKIIWDVDEKRQLIWVYRVEAPDQPVLYRNDDLIDCEPLLPNWRRRVADIFDSEASAKVVAGEVAAEWHAEGEVEGFAKGAVEGFAKGEAEGITKTLRAVLPLLAQAHFRAALPADLPARLAQCDLAQLQALQATLPTVADLAAWLALLPQSE